MTTQAPPGLRRLNGEDRERARAALLTVCASHAWADTLLDARPHPGLDALLALSDSATARLDRRELAAAIAAHPPIGRPRPGDPDSAREQAGMAGADDALRAEMLELNLRYQERFGHVFLICATGLTGPRMRDALLSRLDNPDEAERAVVRTELAKINRIRLTRLADAAPADATEGDPR
ncbi:2-oxo-4-hydroxy-4-carboxy-5-ureidoimidazoline decarboxylase [Streptomyces otsuchiensis]|uniref:2-oxo-4-hydroxy-4-carboxy-5-ureidoimidazoline decarboxylase n=1 Tax=Streptomyces otsuchiensis TaxID=2681388 RepID=UPI0010315C29|nr:2-oxo-4-hydroxy-4-carboxy-5-ureidoimidazoline decarboxylase [Streptomyces otsuchiensis]